MKKLLSQRIISFITVFAVVISLACALPKITEAEQSHQQGNNHPAAGNIFVTVPNVIYEQFQAATVLKRLNEIRKEAFDQNKPDAHAHHGSSYVPLTWSKNLELIAEIRALEASYLWGHSRPNGADGPWMTVNGTRQYAENIAWNGFGIMYSIERYYSEKPLYDADPNDPNAGHYRNMISSSYKSVGSTCVIRENRHYNAMEFTFSKEADKNRSNSASGVPRNMEVSAAKVIKMYFTANNFRPLSGKISLLRNNNNEIKAATSGKLKIGETGTLIPKVDINFNGNTVTNLKVSDGVTWQSSNTNVATVSASGVVKAKQAGQTTITAKIGSTNKKTASYRLTVFKEAQTTTTTTKKTTTTTTKKPTTTTTTKKPTTTTTTKKPTTTTTTKKPTTTTTTTTEKPTATTTPSAKPTAITTTTEEPTTTTKTSAKPTAITTTTEGPTATTTTTDKPIVITTTTEAPPATTTTTDKPIVITTTTEEPTTTTTTENPTVITTTKKPTVITNPTSEPVTTNSTVNKPVEHKNAFDIKLLDESHTLDSFRLMLKSQDGSIKYLTADKLAKSINSGELPYGIYAIHPYLPEGTMAEIYEPGRESDKMTFYSESIAPATVYAALGRYSLSIYSDSAATTALANTAGSYSKKGYIIHVALGKMYPIVACWYKQNTAKIDYQNGTTENIPFKAGKAPMLMQNPVKAGYKFVGYAYDKAGKAMYDARKADLQHDLTLFAVWQKGQASQLIKAHTPATGERNHTLLAIILVIIAAAGAGSFVLIRKNTSKRASKKQ